MVPINILFPMQDWVEPPPKLFHDTTRTPKQRTEPSLIDSSFVSTPGALLVEHGPSQEDEVMPLICRWEFMMHDDKYGRFLVCDELSDRLIVGVDCCVEWM